jgi:hypothetical protein
LYRFTRGKTRPVPVITLVIIGSTALVTGLQFIFPEVLTALRRNREGLQAGEGWRMVTPLFVHAYGCSESRPGHFALICPVLPDVCQIDSGLLVCYGRRHVRAFPRANT